MYDLLQHNKRQLLDQQIYDDEYDEYLLWHSTSPHVMVRAGETYELADIPPTSYLRLDSPWPTPPASPLLVSYVMTPDFKFPAVETDEEEPPKSPSVPDAEKDTQLSNEVAVARQGLPKRKRSYSSLF